MKNTSTPAGPPEFLRLRQILRDWVPVARSTLFEWIASGKFPRGTRISPGVVVWKRDDILSFIEGHSCAPMPYDQMQRVEGRRSRTNLTRSQDGES